MPEAKADAGRVGLPCSAFPAGLGVAQAAQADFQKGLTAQKDAISSRPFWRLVMNQMAHEGRCLQ